MDSKAEMKLDYREDIMEYFNEASIVSVALAQPDVQGDF